MCTLVCKTDFTVMPQCLRYIQMDDESKHFCYPRLHLLLKQEDLKAHHLELELIDRKRTVTRLHKEITAPEYVVMFFHICFICLYYVYIFFHSSRLAIDVLGTSGNSLKQLTIHVWVRLKGFMSSGFTHICLSVVFC